MPAVSKLGKQPIKKVAVPIKTKTTIKIVRRPILSPKWPKSRAPKGRETKAIPYTARDNRSARSLSSPAKKTVGKITAAAVP